MRGRRVLTALIAAFTVVTAVVAPAHAAVTVSDTPTAGWSVNGRVYATAIVGDTVIVGGTFTAATDPAGTSVARKNLAAFSLSSGSLLTGWRADAGGGVRAIVSDGTSLWVAGAFGKIGGVTRTRIAKLSVASGAVDESFNASADNTVRALDLKGGWLYAGGAFLNANGQPRTRLAKFEAGTGALDQNFNASANRVVMGLVKHPAADVLYVSGAFSSVGSAARNGVAAVSSMTGDTAPVVFASAARPTLGLTVNPDGSRLYGAGGSGSNAAAAWNTSTGSRTWRQVTDGDIQAIAYHDGTVYFGFHEGYQSDTTLKLLAADAETGILQSFYPRFDAFWGIFAIAVSDSGVVAGGEFTTVSGVSAQGFVRFPVADEAVAEPVVTKLVSSTSTWTYWDKDSRPDGWQGLNFDDSTWRSGLPQLGYGDGDEATTISSGDDPTRRNVTAYFRTRFTVTEIPRVLKLELLADDGAVVHVNGVQVLRDNMPEGAVTHTTLASTTRSGGPENALRPFSINPERLRIGTNVLAVEVHQANQTSDDLGIDANLLGTS